MTSYVANHLLPSLFTHGHTTFIRKTRHLPKSWEHTNDGFYHEHPDVLDGTFQMIGFLVLSTATEVWVPLVPVLSQCTEKGTSIDRGRSGYMLGWRMRTVPLVDIESTDATPVSMTHKIGGRQCYWHPLIRCQQVALSSSSNLARTQIFVLCLWRFPALCIVMELVPAGTQTSVAVDNTKKPIIWNVPSSTSGCS